MVPAERDEGARRRRAGRGGGVRVCLEPGNAQQLPGRAGGVPRGEQPDGGWPAASPSKQSVLPNQ